MGKTLVDKQIVKRVKKGDLKIHPWEPEEFLQGHSLDVRLGGSLRDPVTNELIDLYEHRRLISARVDIGYLMQPGEFLLGSTLEDFTIPANMLMKLEGKSSLGRQGLFVHITAGHIEGGFTGQVTLELLVVGKQALHLLPGMRIGQMLFEKTAMPKRPYGHPDLGSHYQGQHGPTLARTD